MNKFVLVLVAAAITVKSMAVAATPLKIGVVVPLSGIYADHGKQMMNGFNLFMKQHGNEIAGREVSLIFKDETGPAPDIAKRIVQELIVKDKVELISGFDFTPNAIAIASLATQAKVPVIITNAAASGIPQRSPYIVRTSFVTGQIAAPVALWAAKNGIKRVYSLVADFAPGYEAEAAFKKAFLASGGSIIGSGRVPLQNPDFSPFVQRIKDEKPDAVFLYQPAPGGIAFSKVFAEKQLALSGIRLISTGDLVEEQSLEALGNSVEGVITSHHYSSWHESSMNKEFVAEYQKAYGTRPNFYAVGSYDGMQLIYAALKKLSGKITPDSFMAAVKGMQLESPRGQIKIDVESRDIVETIYVRRTEKGRAGMQNTEVASYPSDPDASK